MKRAWRAWVELWDHREDAAALALVRILVGLVLVYDYVDIARLDLASAIYTREGFATSDVHAWWIVAFVAAIAIATGTLTRVACVVFVIASATLAHASPNGERGIDIILRIVIGVLAFSQCHARWSIDALVRRRLGRPLATDVPAWPRYLLLLQLVWIYFSGALNKGGASWFPNGDFLALSNVLGDPHVARFEPGWAPVVVTQVATALTMAFELGAPLYLGFYYFAATRERRGRLRILCNRLRLRWLWIAAGVGFHVGIAISMRLGIFPFGMLALYPVLLLPKEHQRLALTLRVWRR